MPTPFGSFPFDAAGVDNFAHPLFINAFRAPTTKDIQNPGTQWQDNSVSVPVIYQTVGGGIWGASNTSGSFTALTVVGTANINVTGSAVTTIGTGGTGAVNIGNATGNTAVTGSLTSTGRITAGTGLNSTTGNLTLAGTGAGLLVTPTVASGASPQTANGRIGFVTFTGVSIAAGAAQAFTISNSAIAGSGTELHLAMFGATTGAALTIQSVVNSASQSIITVINGTGATTTTANITFTYFVLN